MRCIILVTVVVALPFFCAADNGVDGISDLCVECLKTIQLYKNITCLPHKSDPNAMLCGAFRMSKGFYVDCSAAMRSVPPEWNTWEKCYESDECGAACVKAYHNRFTSNCQSVLPDRTAPLQCQDYGQIHYGGPNSCGNPNLAAVDFITNMTLQCGCETVTGNRTACLEQLNKPDCPEKNLNRFLIPLIIVATISFVIIIIIIIIAVCCYKNKRPPGHPHEKGRVVSQRFQNLPESSVVPATVTSEAVQKMLMQSSPSTPQHEILRVETQSPALGPRGRDKAAASVAADDISLSMTRNVPVSSEVPPPAYELDYVNACGAAEGTRRSSSSSNTLESRVRAPIPVPR